MEEITEEFLELLEEARGAPLRISVLRVLLALLFFSSPLFAQEPFYANKITFESDIPFSKEELFYLTDLCPDSTITPTTLTHAYHQLKQKKRFDSITHIVHQSAHDTTLHFKLIAHWMFKKIRVTGVLFEKHSYENLYLQHPGDIFDISLHEESLQEIKKTLHQKGYLSHSIQDELFYDKHDKSITVKIKIAKGRRTRINHVRFIINHSTFDTTALTTRLQDQVAPFLLGNRYTKKTVRKARQHIQAILVKHGFVHHRITLKHHLSPGKRGKKKASLLFTITLGKKLAFACKGNRFFSTKKILNELIDLTKPSWLCDPIILGEQILHEYHRHGFWHAKIQYKNDTFVIDEGKRIRVTNIIIKQITTDKEEKNKFFFEPALKAEYYNEAILHTCIEKLKTFYIKHGFWDFAIIDQQFMRDDAPDTFSVIIFVDKGVQRFLHENHIPFNPSLLAQKRLSILEDFQKKGFWYVDVSPTLVSPTRVGGTSVTDTSITVTWNITPGEQVRFGKLFLRGNTRLPFNRILREVDFKEGELWDRKKLDYTRSKLKKLSVFKHIEIHPKKISAKQSKKPIILTLIDDDPVELKLRTGYFLTSKNFLLKRESTYKLGGSILMKNPLNLADKASFDANVTRFEKDFDFCYQIPHPLNYPFTTKCKAYYHKYIHPLEVGKSDSAYEAIQDGFLLGITKEYKSRSFWGINIGNEWVKTTRVRGNVKLSNNMINTTIPYFFIEPNLIIDRTNDKLNTTKGSLTFFSTKMMIPETNRTMTYKIMLDQSLFHHFGRNVVGAIRMRLGHIFKQKFEEIMPIERFYLGGPFSVRGYSKDTVPPLGKTIRYGDDETCVQEYTIQGGSSMMNGNLELRFPIYKSLGGVVFQDVGVLSQSGLSWFKGTWSPTTGLGLRYQTPIGALRFDIGWKWRKSFPNDTSYAWYLTLGQAF